MISLVIKHKIKMEMTGKEKRPYIEVMQDDAFSRILEIDVQQNGLPQKLPSTCHVLIRYWRPDGEKGAYDTMGNGEQAWYLRGNVVGVLLAPEVCAVAGTAVLVLEISEDRERLFSFPVDVEVKGNPDVQKTRVGKTYCAGYLPQPNEPQVGQFVQIQEIDERGRVIRTESASVPDGKSAYAYAQEWGYEGTEAEFAEKLAGPNTGISIGTMEPADHSTVWIDTGEEPEMPPAGRDGVDGKSAYQYALDGGYAGTEAEFAVKLAAEYPQPDWNALEGEKGHVLNKPGLIAEVTMDTNNGVLDASGAFPVFNYGEELVETWQNIFETLREANSFVGVVVEIPGAAESFMPASLTIMGDRCLLGCFGSSGFSDSYVTFTGFFFEKTDMSWTNEQITQVLQYGLPVNVKIYTLV